MLISLTRLVHAIFVVVGVVAAFRTVWVSFYSVSCGIALSGCTWQENDHLSSHFVARAEMILSRVYRHVIALRFLCILKLKD